MSTVLQEDRPARARFGWRPWVAPLIGLAFLYIPSYVALANGLWREEAYAHGPIILAVVAFLLWRGRAALLDESLRPAPAWGALLLLAGLALYLLGHTQRLALFEVGSHLPVIAGLVLLVRGFGGLRRLAFPILFLAFLVPLPGFVVEAATGPLKELVSAIVASVLGVAGHAVERNGVVLLVDGHELLVADACSGMNSLASLFALTLLYMHLLGRRGIAYRFAVLAGIVPIAVAANALRVIALSLVAVNLGDDAARGWLHDVIGFTAFGCAFALLGGYESAVRLLLRPRTAPACATASAGASGPMRFAPLAAGLAMALVAAAAPALMPVSAPQPIDVARAIPESFGDWRVDPDDAPVAVAPDVQDKLDRLYGQVLARTYVNSQGERMMLTVAYGGDQSDALKAHRQEVCYRAQGFDVRAVQGGKLEAAGREIPVTRMFAVRGARAEPVTYWFTMGDRVVRGRLERLRVQVESGLAGRIPDGMLVRVSSLSQDPPRAYAAQAAFVSAIVAAIPPDDASRLVGEAG
jgi:EpsI family protein